MNNNNGGTKALPHSKGSLSEADSTEMQSFELLEAEEKCREIIYSGLKEVESTTSLLADESTN